MKALYKLSILCVLFISSAAWAQKGVVSGLSKTVLKSATERQLAKQTLQCGMLARPPYAAEPISLAALCQLTQPGAQIAIREVPAAFQPQRIIASAEPVRENKRYESPLLPFLKEDWELPAIPPKAPPAYQDKVPATYANWSLNSLRMECSALGILPPDWETYTRPELAYLLSTYKSLAGSAHAPSRFEPAASDKGKSQREQELDLKAWARQQPDFIESNYLSFGDEYEVPFTGEHTPVHILVVNDIWEEVRDLTVAVWQEEDVFMDYAGSIDEAIHKLKLQPKAYDIVLVDHDMGDGTRGPSLSMWAYEKHLSVPMILYTRESMAAEWAYKFNLKGRIDITDDPASVLNYVRNFLANDGRAYPDR